MGIQGLLRNLHPLLVPPPAHPSHNNNNNNNNPQSTSTRTPTPRVQHNIRQFHSKTLAIDASSWLHKAAYTCAERLVESTESKVRDPLAEKSYCKYMLDRCDELLNHAGIRKIYLVFDGIRVPLKRGTNAERESKRQKNLEEARRLQRLGRRKEASEKYRQCVKGNEEMARVVAAAVEKRWGRRRDAGVVPPVRGSVEEGKEENDNSVRVQCIWSPYEADAQLAKLCVDGLAHAVVTEDSDVLVYSAVTRKPFPIIYKLDRKDGSCDVVTMDWLVNPTFLAMSSNGSTASRRGMSSRRRRRMDQARDLEYIYNDGPLEDEEEEKENVNVKNEAVPPNNEKHPSEVEYDDLGLAPIRRSLPMPSVGTKSTRRKRRGSNSSDGGGGNAALLAYLRSFVIKEVAQPGAGVRLFVQACVLSGCDYVPNRLSKVGPLTAFKLVKETSHRAPEELFERVLKSLPPGSRLLAEETPRTSSKGSSEEENCTSDFDGEEEDDLLTQPDNDRDAKEKYEELLSKSQAVFYYHLVKELETGEIVPLVGHNVGDKKGCDDGAKALREVDVTLRPCTERFETGLLFVGSAAEALKKKPTPLPALTGAGQGASHYRRPAAVAQYPSNAGGWMSTNRRNNNLDPLYPKSAPKKPNVGAFPPPPKETALQRYLKGQPKKKSTTTSIRALSNNNSVNKDTNKSVGGSSISDKKRKLIASSYFGASSAAVGKKTYPLHKKTPTTKIAALTTSTASSIQPAKPNQFNSFAYPASSKDEAAETCKNKKSPISSSAADTALLTSTALLSPVKFDYGGNTPPPDSTCEKSKPKISVDDNNTLNNGPIELLDADDEDSDEDDVSEQKQLDPCPGTIPNAHDKLLKEYKYNHNTTNDGNGFDYGSMIVEESPPRKAADIGILSNYIYHSKSSFCDDDQDERPRRVSTSPQEHRKRNNGKMQRRNGPEKWDSAVIDLIGDSHIEDVGTAEAAAVGTKKPVVDENYPNCGIQTSSISKSFTNKREFKNPKTASQEVLANKRASSSSLQNTIKMAKTQRTAPSSSAILAGFARQAASSGKTSGNARKSKFFPTASDSGTEKKMVSGMASKRPGGTRPLEDFMFRPEKDR